MPLLLLVAMKIVIAIFTATGGANYLTTTF